ncbi:hypothetical protein [Bryobacter aggregatus]|uniref:hypothetical protein n=1 Tax=Bryobacter aggregatus TaxID=360054 RepID=UPI0004E1CD40|nr:hypothetical protein [Bryobacter aggregatus]
MQLREAEKLALSIPNWEQRLKSLDWVGRIYARAGYLEDAKRAFGKQAAVPYAIWTARLVSGDLPGALRDIATIPSEPMQW